MSRPIEAADRGVGRTLTNMLAAGRLPLVAAGTAALAGAAFVAHALHFWGITVDDAAISYTYARNLAAGDGLTLRPGGERVEAYSNLLWVLILAGGNALGAEIESLSKALGVLFGLAALGVVAALPARLQGRRLLLPDVVPAVALAGSTTFAVWSVAGLENSLFALLVLVSFGAVAAEGRSPSPAPWSALALALLAMTRPEGPAYAVAAVLWRGARWLRDPFRRYRLRAEATWLALLVAGLALPVALRQAYFGYPLPNAYYIKSLTWPFSAGHLLDAGSSGWRYLTGFLRAYGLAPLLILLPAGLLDRRSSDVHALGILMLSAGLFFPIYVQGDWMPEWRFMSLVTPLLLLLAGSGLVAVLHEIRARWPATRAGAGMSIAVATGCAGFLLIALHMPLRRTPAMDGDRFTDLAVIRERGEHFADWARRIERPDATLLDVDLGGISLVSGLDVIDLFGLADLSISRHRWRPTLVREYLFGERRPTFIHLHGAWFGAYHLHEYEEMAVGYVQLPQVSPSGRRAGGRNWVRKEAIAAPWTPAPRDQAVEWDGGVVRLLGMGGAPDAVAPGGEYRQDFVFTVSRPTVWEYEGALLVLPPATPVRGAWRDAPAVLVSTDFRPYDEESGELILAFRCPEAGVRRVPRVSVRLQEPGGAADWDVPGDFVAPAERWRRGADCLWRGTVAAPRAEYDLLIEWYSGRGTPWRRVVEGLDTRVGGEPTPVPFAFGLYPSNRWVPGERVVGRARTSIPEGTAEGRRRVLLALRQRLPGGEGAAGTDFVTAASGMAYVEIGEIEVGDDAELAAYRRLEGGIASALATGRLGDAGQAFEALRRYDDGRGRAVVQRAGEGYAGALLSRAVILREAGDLATAAILTRRAEATGADLPSLDVVRSAVARDLRALAGRARKAGDADAAFDAFASALTLEPHVPEARAGMEALRPDRLRAYDPEPFRRAWAEAEAVTRIPTDDRLDRALTAMIGAGLDEEAAALCPWSTCGATRGAAARTALAGVYRRSGDLVEAASLVDPAAAGPTGPEATLLRHDVLSLLGRHAPPGEVAELRTHLPNPTDIALGPYAALAGWSAERTEEGPTELRFHLLRQGRPPAGAREVTIEASGTAGSRRVRRIVTLSPGPLAEARVLVRLPTGIYRLALTVEDHGSAVLDGVSIEGPNWGFEDALDWQGWRAEGAAFGAGPVERQTPAQQDVTGWRGLRYANSFHGGDAARGKLTSAPFIVDRPAISFLVGGGRRPGEAEVRLVVGGEVVRRETGRQTERLRRAHWDVRDLLGRTATVEVEDDAVGPWGHLLFDDLRLSDSPAGQ